MHKSLRWTVPLAALGVAGLGLTMPGAASAATSTTYQASLQPVALNTPAGAASGSVTLALSGSTATITEHVSGLAPQLPSDTTTLNALGIPSAFAGAPFPHVQHIHINGQNGGCPTSSADANHDGLITVTEAADNYGPIGTTLSVKGDTSPKSAADVTIAPGGGSFTYHRTITLDQATLTALQSGKAEVVVHGLNPANAPKASLTTDNSLGVTLPGANKKVKAIATAPALCGALTTSQMSATPVGSSPTGGGSTAGLEDGALLGVGGGLILAAGGIFAMRRRYARQS
ncbi:MAG: hypothetical protein ACTHMS_18490 [Jatrophihabitans sp.]|uniref:hypothetical protein n=1 Tax=Jatrophihabitans sp. TaxID=1932789 RepID=UPI003F803F76